MQPIPAKKEILIIAGEKSGEEHALSFLNDFPENEYKFFGVGGDDLKKNGVELIYHLKDFSSIGFVEVVRKIPFYLRAAKHLVQEVKRRNCQYAILIDFQGFNLALAKRLKKAGVKVFYYVAPQAWVWKPWRAKTLAKCVEFLFTIIPFEKKWFMARGVEKVVSVPHPLFVTYRKRMQFPRPLKTFPQNGLNVLLLPGSRTSEIRNHLPIIMEAAKKLKESHTATLSIVVAKHLNADLFKPFLKDVDFIYDDDQLDMAMDKADVSIATSGTVTLATGLFNIPTVVVYKTSWINELILKLFMTYDGPVSLTNIVLEERTFPELLQKEMDSDKIVLEVEKFLSSNNNWSELQKKLASIPSKLSGEVQEVGAFISKRID